MYISNNARIVLGKEEAAIYQFDKKQIIRVNLNVAEKITSNRLTKAQKLQLLNEGIISPKAIDEHEHLKEATSESIDKAWLELTANCNHRCIHCYVGNEQQEKGHVFTPLDQGKWFQVIDYLKQWNCKDIVLIGGEPLICPILFKVIRYIRKINGGMVNIVLVTNGTLLTDSKLKELKKMDVCIKFAILGPCAAVHDSITQVKGSFNKVVKTIHKAIQYKLKYDIGVTLLPTTEKYKDKILSFCRCTFHITTAKIKFSYARPQGRCNSSIAENCTLHTNDFLVHKISKDYFSSSQRHHTCLFKKIAISYTGKIYPCIMTHYVFKKTDDIFYVNPFKAFQEWWFLTKDKIEGCKNCALRYACFDCRGYAHSLSGAPLNCKLATKLQTH